MHEHGYRIERPADGELRFFRRDGSPVPAAGMGPPSRISANDGRHGDGADAGPLAALRDAHAARGLGPIDARTAFPRWDGTPVDYGLAVQALL